MTIETAGKLSNGIVSIATVDNEEKEIHIICPAGWKVTILPSNSGARLSSDHSTPRVISLNCIQVDPIPELL